MDPLRDEKLRQVPGLLNEEKIDLWLTFGRESSATPDPIADVLIGSGYTWQSAFLLHKSGARVAIVGSLEEPHYRTLGLYPEIIGYKASIREPLLAVLKRFKPRKIAVNTSVSNVLADGLTHGMYEILAGYLRKTPYAKRLVSSESLVAKLRGRKSATELARIGRAVAVTEEIIDVLRRDVRVGMTEKEAASILSHEVEKRGLVPAWDPLHCPAVFTGPESAGAHSGPTDRKIEPGHLMNIDFGVRLDGYCSDLQRTWYFLRAGERKAPPAVQKAFNTIRDAIEIAGKELKPGVEMWNVDRRARSHITSAGYDEFQHATGHEIGRQAHDGLILCPKWERYGKIPKMKTEEGQVYTLEPRINVPGHGVATMEEIAVVTKRGAKYLSHPQRELWLS
jgi:Xaa-Pro aminopeptidase